MMGGRHKCPDSPSWTEQALGAFDRWTDKPNVPSPRGAHVAPDRGPKDALANDDEDTEKCQENASSHPSQQTLTV